LGFGVWGLGFGCINTFSSGVSAYGAIGFRVWGLGCMVDGFGTKYQCLGDELGCVKNFGVKKYAVSPKW
jgi:hypothetical protein